MCLTCIKQMVSVFEYASYSLHCIWASWQAVPLTTQHWDGSYADLSTLEIARFCGHALCVGLWDVD